MANSQIKREIAIELKLIGSPESKAAAAKAKAEVTAVQAAATKAIAQREREETKAAAARQKALEKETELGVKAVEKLDRQRSKALEKEIKDRERAEQRKMAAAQRTMAALDRQRSRAYAQELKEQERLVKETERANQRRIAEVERWRAAQESANRQVLGATKQTLEGVASLGRGIAYMGLLGEENTEKLVKGLVQVEGAFSIVKGGIDLWVGMSDMIKASTAATLAQVKANELLAASQVAVNATAPGVGVPGAAAGKGAANAANAARAGVGTGTKLLMGANTAATAWYSAPALTAGAKWVGSRVGGAAARVGGMVGRGLMNPLTGAVATGALVGNYASSFFSEDGKGTFETGQEAINTYRSSRQMSRRLAEEEKKRQPKLDMARERDERIAAASSFAAQTRSQQEAFRRESAAASGASAIEQAQQSRAAAVREMEQAELAAQQERQRALERQNQMQVKSYADQLQAQERLYQAAEQRKAAEQEMVAALQDQLNSRRQAVEQAQNELKAARETLKAEREKTKDKAAQFGRLSAGEQSRLVAIAEKQKSGQDLSRSEIETLDQSGFGQDIVRDYYAKRGNESGASSVLTGLGERKGEMEASGKLQTAQSKLLEAQAKQEQASRQMAEATQKLSEAIDKAASFFGNLQNLNAESQGLPSGDSGASVASMGNSLIEVTKEVERNAKRTQEQVAAQAIQ